MTNNVKLENYIGSRETKSTNKRQLNSLESG